MPRPPVGRQAVLERPEVVLVDGHRLFVARGRAVGLLPRSRARCSSGSMSSLKALPSSRPATMGSNRSTKPGSSRWSRASGETSFG